MICVLSVMSWICFLIHLVIFIWAMLRRMRWAMSLLATGFKRVTTSCTRSGGTPLVYRPRMLRSNVDQIHASGPTKILQYKRRRCDVMHVLSIGTECSTQVILSTTNGINGSSCRCTRRALPTEKIHRSTGAQIAKLF